MSAVWTQRIFYMLLSAEWILFFRIWLSPQMLLLLLGFTAFRFMLLAVIPFYEALFGVYAFAGIALLFRLRSLVGGRSGRNRETLNTPETGVPWLMAFTKSERLTTIGVEPILVAIFI